MPDPVEDPRMVSRSMSSGSWLATRDGRGGRARRTVSSSSVAGSWGSVPRGARGSAAARRRAVRGRARRQARGQPGL